MFNIILLELITVNIIYDVASLCVFLSQNIIFFFALYILRVFKMIVVAMSIFQNLHFRVFCVLGLMF